MTTHLYRSGSHILDNKYILAKGSLLKKLSDDTIWNVLFVFSKSRFAYTPNGSIIFNF